MQRDLRSGHRAGPRSGLAAATVAVTLAVVTAVVSAAPASGHASGELPRAELRADGSEISIDFVAPPDDAAVIGITLGILGEGAMAALLGGPAEDLPTEAQIAELSGSPALRDYLEERIVVRQDGEPCPGEAFPAPDFLSDGARLEFRCPAVVEQADVRTTVLHDEDPAYRTFSVDGTVQYAIHSAAAPEHTWDFTVSDEGPGGLDPALAIGAGVLLLVIAVAIAFVAPRRRRRGPA